MVRLPRFTTSHEKNVRSTYEATNMHARGKQKLTVKILRSDCQSKWQMPVIFFSGFIRQLIF